MESPRSKVEVGSLLSQLSDAPQKHVGLGLFWFQINVFGWKVPFP